MTDTGDAFKKYMQGLSLEDQFDRDTMRRAMEEICKDVPYLSEQILFLWDFIDYFRSQYVANAKIMEDDITELTDAGLSLVNVCSALKSMVDLLHDRIKKLEVSTYGHSSSEDQGFPDVDLSD